MDKSFVYNICTLIGIPGMDDLLLKLMGCENLDGADAASSSMSSSFFSNQLRYKIFEALTKKDKKNDPNAYDLEAIMKVSILFVLARYLISPHRYAVVALQRCAQNTHRQVRCALRTRDSCQRSKSVDTDCKAKYT